MDRQPLERILVPLDHSPVSEKLVEFAGELASHYGSEIVLFTAIDSSILEHAAAGFDPNTIIRELEDKYREILSKYAEKLKSKSVRVVVHDEIPVTEPCSGIIAAARKEGVSEILIATKGWGWRRLIPIGGTARTVIKLSPVPVIALRAIKEEDRVKLLGDPKFARRLVVGIDENVTTDMIRYVSDLARRAGTETIYLVHVAEKLSDKEAASLLEKVADKLGDVGAEIMKVVLAGKPARVLSGFATPPTATGLIVGRSVKKFFSEIILGSTVDRVLQEAMVPIVVYPVSKEEY